MLEFLVDGLDFGNFFLLDSDLPFDLFFVLLFLFVELGDKVFGILFGLVEEVAVLNLEFVAFVVELELGLFHEFFVLVLNLLDFIGVFLFQDFDFVLDFFVSCEFVVDLFLVVLFEFGDFLVVSFLFKLEFF